MQPQKGDELKAAAVALLVVGPLAGLAFGPSPLERDIGDDWLEDKLVASYRAMTRGSGTPLRAADKILSLSAHCPKNASSTRRRRLIA